MHSENSCATSMPWNFTKKNDIYCHKRLIINIFWNLAEFFGSAEKNLRNVEISLCRDRPTIRPHIIFCMHSTFKISSPLWYCQHDYTSKHINQREDYACNCRYMTSVLYVWPKNMRFFLFITKYTYLYVIMSKIIMKIY